MTINSAKIRSLISGFASNGTRHARTGVAAVIAAAVAAGIAWGPDAVGSHSGAGVSDGFKTQRLTSKDVADSDLAKPKGVIVVAGSAKGLYTNFRKIGYRLEDVRAGVYSVPRVYVKAIPKDIRSLQSVDKRKQVFIKTMLPLILRVNEELRASRQHIKALEARLKDGDKLDSNQKAWLNRQYARYGVGDGKIHTLLRRVDVIPPSLALAQAAEESGWGTSRFALEGRALFGQRAHPEGKGIVPTAHSEDSGIKVKSFSALLDGVRSYARNLNTHGAYAAFRKERAAMRVTAHSPAGLNSLKLASTLINYSERGQAYVDTIQTIIRANNLRQLDGAQLSDASPKLELTELADSGA